MTEIEEENLIAYLLFLSGDLHRLSLNWVSQDLLNRYGANRAARRIAYPSAEDDQTQACLSSNGIIPPGSYVALACRGKPLFLEDRFGQLL